MYKRQAQDSLSTFYRTLRHELKEQVKKKNFPAGQRFRYYLRNQPVIKGLAELRPDINFRKWTATQVEMEKEPLAQGQNVYHGPLRRPMNRYSRPHSAYYNMLVIAEKPQGVTLKAFLDSPTMILNTVLNAVPYFRYVGRERVAVSSLGEPEKTEHWRDTLGRRWNASLWYLPYSDHFLYSRCLPSPNGAVCIMMSTRTDLLSRDYLAASRESCEQLLVGYQGSLDNWEEYFSLGETYLPTYFQGAAISHKKGRIKVRMHDFQLDLTRPEITGESILHLHLGYANDRLLAEDLVLFSLVPEKEGTDLYTVLPLFEPSPFNSDAYTTTWKESISGTGDFSGKIIFEGDQVLIQKPSTETEKTIIDPDGRKIKKIFTLGCTYKASAAGEKNVEQDCERFFQSIQFTGK